MLFAGKKASSNNILGITNFFTVSKAPRTKMKKKHMVLKMISIQFVRLFFRRDERNEHKLIFKIIVGLILDLPPNFFCPRHC